MRHCWAIIHAVFRDWSPSASRGPSFCLIQTREVKQASRLNVGHLSQRWALAGRGMCFSYSTGKRYFAFEHSFPTTFVLPVAENRAAPGPANCYLQWCQQYLRLIKNSQSDCLPSDSEVATIVSAQRPTSSKGTSTVVQLIVSQNPISAYVNCIALCGK